MSQYREPYPVPDLLKQPLYRALRLAERGIRGIAGANPRVDPASLCRIRNFLLPQFQAALGCTVHATPVVEAIHLAVPNARIVGAMSGIALDVYRHHPGLDAIHKVPAPTGNLRAAARQLRRIVASFDGEPYGVLFTCGAQNVRASLALAVMISGNGVRGGINVALPLLHLPLRLDRSVSQIANNLRVPRAFGHQGSFDLEPRIYFSSADLDHARSLLRPVAGHPIVLLVTRTSGGQPTAWPEDRFLAVTRHLIATYNCSIVLPGTRADEAPLRTLAERIGTPALSLAGQTSVPQLAAVCALSDMAVTLDTGVLHVARSQMLPVAIIAPGWQNSVDWMPIGKPWARILKGPKFLPPPPPNYAIEEVSVDAVIAAADDLFRAFPPSAAAREARTHRSVADTALIGESVSSPALSARMV